MLRRLIEVDGYLFEGRGEGDLRMRVRDVELAERLGFQRPRKIRDLISRLEKRGVLSDLDWCPVVGHQSTRGEGTRSFQVREAWLTEAQALKVVAKSETPKADALLDEIIRVYMLARRGLLAEAQAAAGAPPDAALAARVAALEAEVRRRPAQAKLFPDATEPEPPGRSRRPSLAEHNKLILEAAGNPANTWQSRRHLAEAIGGAGVHQAIAWLFASGELVEVSRSKRVVTPALAADIAARAFLPPPDAWKGPVEAYLASLPAGSTVTTAAVFRALGSPGPFDRGAQSRIGLLLGQAGWVYGHRPLSPDGGRHRLYVRAHQAGSVQ